MGPISFALLVCLEDLAVAAALGTGEVPRCGSRSCFPRYPSHVIITVLLFGCFSWSGERVSRLFCLGPGGSDVFAFVVFCLCLLLFCFLLVFLFYFKNPFLFIYTCKTFKNLKAVLKNKNKITLSFLPKS